MCEGLSNCPCTCSSCCRTTCVGSWVPTRCRACFVRRDVKRSLKSCATAGAVERSLVESVFRRRLHWYRPMQNSIPGPSEQATVFSSARSTTTRLRLCRPAVPPHRRSLPSVMRRDVSRDCWLLTRLRDAHHGQTGLQNCFTEILQSPIYRPHTRSRTNQQYYEPPCTHV